MDALYILERLYTIRAHIVEMKKKMRTTWFLKSMVGTPGEDCPIQPQQQ